MISLSSCKYNIGIQNRELLKTLSKKSGGNRNESIQPWQMFCFELHSNALAFPYWLPYCCLVGYWLHMKWPNIPYYFSCTIFRESDHCAQLQKANGDQFPKLLSGYSKWVALLSNRTLGFCDLNSDSLAKMKEVSSGCRCFYVPAIVQFFLLGGNPIWSVLWRSEMLSRTDPNFQRWLGSIGQHLI